MGKHVKEVRQPFIEARNKIHNGEIFLIDSILAGKVFGEIKIHSPHQLINKINKIILTPQALATRNAIVENAVQIGFSYDKIIDPYENL